MKTYIINQAKELHRYLNCVNKCMRGVRVEPVDINESSLTSIAKSSELKYRRELSLQLTVAKIISNQGSPVLILEDDCYFTEESSKYVKKLDKELAQLPGDTGIVLLGAYWKPEYNGLFTQHTNTFAEIHPPAYFWGCHAVIYMPAVIPELTELLTLKKQPAIDRFYSKEIITKYRCFVHTPMFAWQEDMPGMHGIFNFKEMCQTSEDFLNDKIQTA